VVKNLIIINVVMLLLNELLRMTSGINLNGILGLYFPKSEFFRSWQVVTHMFMHGGFMSTCCSICLRCGCSGRILEQVWGPKRFLLYYLVTGLGAAFFFELVQWIQYNKLMGILSPEQLQYVYDMGGNAVSQGKNFTDTRWVCSTRYSTYRSWEHQVPFTVSCWPSGCSSPTPS
jgi:hypothetical protein